MSDADARAEDTARAKALGQARAWYVLKPQQEGRWVFSRRSQRGAGVKVGVASGARLFRTGEDMVRTLWEATGGF